MNLLLTKKLDQDQLDLIRSWGWNYEVVETLKITLIDVDEIPSKSDAWVVSSRNSFDAIRKFISLVPRQIFCVGAWMKNEIEKLNAKIAIKSFENMNGLAIHLAKENFRDVLYFCGAEHRKELEEGLKGTTTKIVKVITHQSEMTSPVIKKTFDAVFVFSPRSAESLLKHNTFSSQTFFACIGVTTENYLHSRGFKNTLIPSFPDVRRLLEEFHRRNLTSN